MKKLVLVEVLFLFALVLLISFTVQSYIGIFQIFRTIEFNNSYGIALSQENLDTINNAIIQYIIYIVFGTIVSLVQIAAMIICGKSIWSKQTLSKPKKTLVIIEVLLALALVLLIYSTIVYYMDASICLNIIFKYKNDEFFPKDAIVSYTNRVIKSFIFGALSSIAMCGQIAAMILSGKSLHHPSSSFTSGTTDTASLV